MCVFHSVREREKGEEEREEKEKERDRGRESVSELSFMVKGVCVCTPASVCMCLSHSVFDWTCRGIESTTDHQILINVT